MGPPAQRPAEDESVTLPAPLQGDDPQDVQRTCYHAELNHSKSQAALKVAVGSSCNWWM